ISATGGQELAVRTVRNATNVNRMPGESENLFPGRDLPDAHRLVGSRRGQMLAVRAEGHTADMPQVSFQGPDYLAARAPDSHDCSKGRLPLQGMVGVVQLPGRGKKSAVGTEGHSVDPLILRAMNGAQLLSGDSVPETNR